MALCTGAYGPCGRLPVQGRYCAECQRDLKTAGDLPMRTPETLTHALTVHQPYSWALAAGHKPVENRTWRPGLEHVGKLVGIHAGKAIDPAEGECWRSVAVPGPRDLTCGALIGVARLVGVVRVTVDLRDGRAGKARWVMMLGRSAMETLSDDLADRIRPWWRGPWGWFFEEAVLLPEPIPMRGQQGLWRIPDVGAWTRDGLSYHPYAAPWALEQWRKARGA